MDCDTYGTFRACRRLSCPCFWPWATTDLVLVPLAEVYLSQGSVAWVPQCARFVSGVSLRTCLRPSGCFQNILIGTPTMSSHVPPDSGRSCGLESGQSPARQTCLRRSDARPHTLSTSPALAPRLRALLSCFILAPGKLLSPSLPCSHRTLCPVVHILYVLSCELRGRAHTSSTCVGSLIWGPREQARFRYFISVALPLLTAHVRVWYTDDSAGGSPVRSRQLFGYKQGPQEETAQSDQDWPNVWCRGHVEACRRPPPSRGLREAAPLHMVGEHFSLGCVWGRPSPPEPRSLTSVSCVPLLRLAASQGA